MIRGGFLKDSAMYLKYIGDGDGGEALYDEYSLSGVLIRGAEYIDESGRRKSGYALYFFEGRSVCERGGDAAEFPKVGENDRCVFGDTPANGRRCRVSACEAGKIGKYIKLSLM